MTIHNLVLNIREGCAVKIGTSTVTVLEVNRHSVKLGIEARTELTIERLGELPLTVGLAGERHNLSV